MTEDKAVWKCQCGWEGDMPTINAGMCNGHIVDILDIFCPGKPGTYCKLDPTLQGTSKEQTEWWNAYYNKMEGNT